MVMMKMEDGRWKMMVMVMGLPMGVQLKCVSLTHWLTCRKSV